MPVDFLVAITFWPVLVGLIALVWVALKSADNVDSAGIAGIGRKRMAAGYLGIAAVTAIYAGITTYYLGLEKVELGHIQESELVSWLPFWSLYMFVLYFVFFAGISTLVGLPLLIVLSHLKLASIVGVCLLALLVCAGSAAQVALSPYNNWCEMNHFHCISKAASESILPALLVALGFGLAAKLPLAKSPSREAT